MAEQEKSGAAESPAGKKEPSPERGISFKFRAHALPHRRRPPIGIHVASIFNCMSRFGAGCFHCRRGTMITPAANKNQNKLRHSALDYLLYVLAGSVVAAISFSFILWLRF
jgi:hypothetical protein